MTKRETEWSWILDRLAIGGMLSYASPVSEHFDFVLNCARELAPEDGAEKDQGIWHIRLDDNDDPEGQREEILNGVRRLTEALYQGDRCLVTCAQGRNRSAVVIAETLIQDHYHVQAQYLVQEAIDRIQDVRDHALTNRAFVSWLGRERSQ